MLKINKQTTFQGLQIPAGIVIQLIPRCVPNLGNLSIPTDRQIWASESDFDSNPLEGTISGSFNEIPDAFYVDSQIALTPDANKSFLQRINEAVKADILQKNPSWTGENDIQIIRL